jgi:hypothetical protein
VVNKNVGIIRADSGNAFRSVSLGAIARRAKISAYTRLKQLGIKNLQTITRSVVVR